jgi:Na+/proline symporter
MFLLIWGTLIIFGCYIAQVAAATGNFDAQKSTLMTFIVSSLANNEPLNMILLFVFMLGLFAAMITTADSLLLVAAQMFSLDFLRLHENDAPPQANIRKAQMSLAGIALLSFAVFAVFHFIKFDVVQLIFAIYGAQLALFPAVVAALFIKKRFDCRKAWLAAAVSIFGGFAGAWGSAFYGKLSGNVNWLYNAPVVALAGSAILLLAFSPPAWRRDKAAGH